MILRAPKRLKPRPGQWIVATNGEGARVLLVTRVLPGKVFFRELRDGGIRENFVTPADVLMVSNGDVRSRLNAEYLNGLIQARDDHIRAGHMVFAQRVADIGLVVE